MYSSGNKFTAYSGHKTGKDYMRQKYEDDSLIYEEAMSQPVSVRPGMGGRSSQQQRPGFNISQRRALVVTNAN